MSKILKPEATIIRTPLDEVGSLLNVERIPGEELKDYAERLYSTYIKRSSSTYDGLLNGINRALGRREQDVLSVNYRAILSGSFSDPSIIRSINSFQNTTSYSGVVDGSSVVAVGTKFFVQNQTWAPESLRGLTLTIGLNKYEILSNSTEEATIDGDMSNLVGQPYTIALELEPNELTGLAIRVDNKIFKIAENTVDTIYINSGNLTDLVDLSFAITAYNPKVEVTASKIYLYKEYINESNFQLEKQIDLRKDSKFHTGIEQVINSCYYFEAKNLLPYKTKILSISFKKQSSENIISREVVPAARYFRLKNPNVKEGSVSFSEASTFLREVEEDQVSQIKGNYFIEYKSGSVLVGSLPSGTKTVTYTWGEFPYVIKNSPAIVNAMANEEVKDFLFSQIEMRLYDNEKNKFIPSQPTSDMLEYIAELLKVKPQTWGM